MLKTLILAWSCADLESIVRGGPTLTTFVLVDEGREGSKYHFKRVIIGLPAKRYLNGVLLSCR